MPLQNYINMDIEYLKKILCVRYGLHYVHCDLDEILTLAEKYKEDIKTYILYQMNPLYDHFVKIGITDEAEMQRILATFFYFSFKDYSANYSTLNPIE